ncbi:MAG: hypothetical protein ACON4H_03345 [Rubripirellula sp.]
MPIPKGIIKPNAYDVFGINTETQDEESIQATIQSVIAELKSVKTSTDSKRWKAAARLASDAKKILADPKQREKLNQKVLVTAGDQSSSSVDTSFQTDPLAGLLPETDPLQKFETSEKPEAVLEPTKEESAILSDAPALPASRNQTQREESKTPEIHAIPPTIPQQEGLESEGLLPPDNSLLPEDLVTSMGSFETPQNDDSKLDSIAVPSFEESAPSFGSDADVMVKKPQKLSRRRRSKTGLLIPAIFAVACFGIVGVVLFFILNKPGVMIAMSDDGVAIQDGTENQENQVADPVQEQKPRSAQPQDPIMGRLGPEPENQNPDANAPKLTDPIAGTDDNEANQASEAMSEEKPRGNQMNNGQAGSANAAPNSTPPSSPEKPTPDEPPAEMQPSGNNPPMESLSGEILQKAEQTLQIAKSAILDADWNQMNSVANKMLDQPMSDDQKRQADDLFQVIDLALFYRTAIVDSINNLNVGNDFEVSDSLRVIIVEKSPSNLTVMFNKMQREYSIDQLPWPLAHKLASFEVSGDTFSTAAKSVYQAIAPTTNPGLQTQALDWIKEIQDDLDGTDKENVGATLSSLITSQ